MKKQKIFVDCPPLKTSALYIVNYSLNELEKFIKNTGQDIDFDKEYFSNADGTAIVFEEPLKEDTVRLVWVKEFKRKSNYDIGVLVHETVHMVVRMLEHKGIPFDSYRNADESLAYYTDFFVRSVLNKIKG